MPVAALDGQGRPDGHRGLGVHRGLAAGQEVSGDGVAPQRGQNTGSQVGGGKKTCQQNMQGCQVLETTQPTLNTTAVDSR